MTQGPLTAETGAPVAANQNSWDRLMGNFRQADGDFGKRREAAVQALRGRHPALDRLS